MDSEPYFVLAYYAFVPLDNPQEEVVTHKQFFEGKDVSCRIYLSEEGINGQLCALRRDALSYIDWMHSRKVFRDVDFKVHEWHEHTFPRATVKYRKNLVALDRKVDLSKRGEHLSPQQWKKMLKAAEDRVLVDVRNAYEWEVGHFEGAELPACDTFREFDAYADRLKQKVDPQKTPVMMYCTGGIRCELYSALLKEKGFEKVYQLKGGIINYGLREGSAHWKGKLFVFDDRLTVPISNDPHEQAEVIGKCLFCQASTESYYNCANMDCNRLFLCCPDCLSRHDGCCQGPCQQSARIRPFQQQNPHKPFRKWYRYFKKGPKGEKQFSEIQPADDSE